MDLPVCSFTPALHPQYERIKAECEPWILAFAAPASQEASQFWLRCQFPLFGSLTYAHGHPHRVVLLVKLVTWFFASDTDDDDPSVRGSETDHDICLRHELILGCYAGKPFHQNLASPAVSDILRLESKRTWPYNNGDTSASAKTSADACDQLPDVATVDLHNVIFKGLPALHDIWKDISPEMPLIVQSRYLNAMRDHLNANRLQAHYRKIGRLPGLEEYRYALRRPTSLVLPCLFLIEYALGIQLDDETHGSEMMIQLLDAVTDHVALANDVLSCEAERCYRDYFNLPSVILREREAAQPGFTFAEAMQEAGRIVGEVDKQCVQLMEEVKNSRLIEKAGVPAFLRGLEFWMAGNVEWSLKTARYSHTCSDEGLVLAI